MKERIAMDWLHSSVSEVVVKCTLFGWFILVYFAIGRSGARSCVARFHKWLGFGLKALTYHQGRNELLIALPTVQTEKKLD